jgi:PadR family transcriptional regulator PadR
MAQDNLDIENTKAQMRKGLLEYCILLTIARQEEAYTSDILQELKLDNLLVVEGTLYPLLSRLKSEEMLEYSWKESKAGPPRKYYRLTPKGEQTLEALNETWHELSSSINSLYKKYEKNN